jgi:serine/threonine protein kinase
MLYCHSRGVIHRDLKLENVLFKNPPEPEDENDLSDYFVKIIDFGIAGVANDEVDAGTLCYMAPECLDKQAADSTPAIDVWAIGIMFYSMMFGYLPFFNQDEKALTKSIRNDPVRFPAGVPITPLGKEVIK